MLRERRKNNTDNNTEVRKIEGNNNSGMVENQIGKDDAMYNRSFQIIEGWKSVDDCAATVWASIHSSLLDGELVYAYRNTNGKSDLQQLVIVKNLRSDRNSGEGYALGMMTSGFTVLYPLVNYYYLVNDVVGEMKKYKLDASVIDNYKYLIQKIGEKYGEEKQDIGN